MECHELSHVSAKQLSCPQIWNIEQKKEREKEKVGGRPAKLNDKKTKETLGPFIREKIRHVVNKTRTVPFIRACLI